LEVLTRVVLKLWDVFSDVGATGIQFLAISNWAIMFHRSCEKCSARALHPATTGHSWFKVQEYVLKDVFAMLPTDPQISSCKERCHTLSAATDNMNLMLNFLPIKIND